MSDLLGRPDLSRTYHQDRKTLIERVEGFAWDGEWYLRATFDDGTPLGSSANAEARIDSLPQSWAWLSGAADPRARRARHWNRRGAISFARMRGWCCSSSLLLIKSEPSPGYIKGYPPGVRENGGQYTHAAVWLAMAMARSGDGTRAAKILRMLNPDRARARSGIGLALRDRALCGRGRRVPLARADRPGRLVLVYGFGGVDVPRLGGRDSGT